MDVLTLTATPIPRTLAMSLEGLRDFSVIATAPQRRLAIRTFVHPYSEGIIREACLRELKRGGQIYFLYNEVSTIQNMYTRLTTLLPEARINIAHGQMRESELEHVMRDFYQQRFNLLLCTTIIETGIDIPTANTIIIHRADKFGLAQLHQLRGRVGRSHHQAYAYLLTPPEKAALTTQATRRLEAIQAMEELGSGFYLAMHDLEIRGAGAVLGDSQSGEMQEVGFSLYSSLLDAAIKSLKAGHEPDMQQPLGVSTEIRLHVPALLPESYCGDIHERLILYKRMAGCSDETELDEIHQELIDRFGLLPDPARALLDSHRLRIEARQLGITRIDAGPDNIQLQFVPEPPIEAIKIIQLIQSSKEYSLSGPDRLSVRLQIPDVGERVKKIKKTDDVTEKLRNRQVIVDLPVGSFFIEILPDIRWTNSRLGRNKEGCGIQHTEHGTANRMHDAGHEADSQPVSRPVAPAGKNHGFRKFDNTGYSVGNTVDQLLTRCDRVALWHITLCHSGLWQYAKQNQKNNLCN